MPKRSRYLFPRRRLLSGRQKALCAVLVFLVSFLLFLIPAVRYFRALTGAMAISNAADLITRTVSDIVEEKMMELGEEERSFVTFEKDDAGAVTAIITDTPRVNILSSELLDAVIAAANRGDLNISVPMGDLLGISLLLGRGPRVPMKITMLTSSRVEVKNVLTSAGINQTKHQLFLEVHVDTDVLLPWEIRSAAVVNEVLVAETVIVGRTPETYVSLSE